MSGDDDRISKIEKFVIGGIVVVGTALLMAFSAILGWLMEQGDR